MYKFLLNQLLLVFYYTNYDLHYIYNDEILVNIQDISLLPQLFTSFFACNNILANDGSITIELPDIP